MKMSTVSVNNIATLTQQNEQTQQDGHRRPEADPLWRQEGLRLTLLGCTGAALTHTRAQRQRGRAAEWRFTTISHDQHQAGEHLAGEPVAGAALLDPHDAGRVV